MREIVIKTVYREAGFHVVRLGNGTIHQFKSEKAARKFLADTNRFLTALFFEANQILSELYSHGREIWIISTEIRATDDLEGRIQLLEGLIKRCYDCADWASGNYFTFINLRKFCGHSKSLIKFYRNVRYVKQTDTLRRHRLENLYTQIQGVEMQLLNYGQIQAYSKLLIYTLDSRNITSISLHHL